MKISIIGYGNMAKALARGLLLNKDNEIRVSAPSLSVGTNEDGIQTNNNNLAIVSDADIIILAVKPMLMNMIVEQISAQIPPNCLVISIATGMSLPWFAKRCPQVAVVRAMPNIAAAQANSATPLIANEFVTAKQKQCAEDIFTNIGIISWAQKEADIDAFTALSGSGPAYVFLFMEAMIKAGKALGIADDIATTFTIQTLNGAVSLASQSELSIEELRKTVTSPAGTTAAALGVFNEFDLDKIVDAAMKAAYHRAKELGQM